MILRPRNLTFSTLSRGWPFHSIAGSEGKFADRDETEKYIYFVLLAFTVNLFTETASHMLVPPYIHVRPHRFLFLFLTRTGCQSKFNWYLPEFHINLPKVNWNRKIQGEQGVLLAITGLIKDQKIDICFLQETNFEINGEESLLNTNGKRLTFFVTQHGHIAGK